MNIILSNFNDIIGPEIINITPKLDKTNFDLIRKVIPHLIDFDNVDVKEEPFIYANQHFSSHNVAFTLPRLDGRAGENEYLITVIIITADTRGIIALVGLKGFLISLRDVCVPVIMKYHSDTNYEEFKKHVDESMNHYLSLAKEFISTQLEAFESGVVTIEDYVVTK